LPVLLERLELLLGVLAGDAVAAAHRSQCLEQFFAPDAERAAARPFGQGEEQVLDREEVVLQLLARRLGRGEHVVEGATEAQLAAVGARELGDRLVGPVAQHKRRQPETLEHRQDDRAVLAKQGGEQVVGRELRVGVGLGPLLGGTERFLRLLRPLLRVEHDPWASSSRAALPALLARRAEILSVSV
jgi:hypothetical protein